MSVEDKSNQIFSTTDPLGRQVVLKSSTWNMHIIDGDNLRPELEGQEENIKTVIEDPKFIIPDPIENRERYIDIIHFTSTDKIKPVMIVVDHSSNTGDVCTVFPQSRMRDTAKEGFIYVRPKL